MPPRNVTTTAMASTSNHNEWDINALLQKSQPAHFDGEGTDVGKKLEEQLEHMDDYFDLAQSTDENKATIGSFKLEKSAKLWWKNHCLENSLTTSNVTWDTLKEALKNNYQNHTYQVERINEFMDCQ